MPVISGDANALTSTDSSVEKSETIFAGLDVQVRPRLAITTVVSPSNEIVDIGLHLNNITPQTFTAIRVPSERAVIIVELRSYHNRNIIIPLWQA